MINGWSDDSIAYNFIPTSLVSDSNIIGIYGGNPEFVRSTIRPYGIVNKDGTSYGHVIFL